MILKPLAYNVANLLHSDDAVAVCQAEGEKLKDLISLAHDAGWGLLVIETPSGEHVFIVATNRKHEGNLVGEGRNPELPYESIGTSPIGDWRRPKRYLPTITARKSPPNTCHLIWIWRPPVLHLM